VSIKGILPVIPTPFLDGRFDPESFQRLLDQMLDHVDGYTLLGSTGESPSMTTQERIAIAEQALAMTPKDKTVVVGVTHTSIADTVALARHAQTHGAQGVLCALPYYFANTPGGALGFLHELDDALTIELVLYDNPVPTNTNLAADTVLSWARELEHLRTVKLTDHDLDKIPQWQEGGLSVLAGDDPILFRYVAAGVDGAMVIVPALFPEAFRRTFDLAKEGDLGASYEVFATEILPFTHVFGIGDEIATTKALLAMLGVFASDELRPPLEPASPARRELLRIGHELATRRKSAPRSL
jgi:4-hydroxy-tetrahydrodipicolinate synthase